jgi:hypothetical protein
VAVNCCVSPFGTEAAVGETVTATRTAGSTVTAAVPLSRDDGSVAVMVAAPVPVAVTNPWEPDALETVATELLDDDQVTFVVRFCVVRSE